MKAKKCASIFIAGCLLLFTMGANAQSILLMNGECGGSAEYGPVALGNLGLGFTEVNDWSTFETEFGDGSGWDMVIIDSYGSGITTAGETALVDFIGNGGLALVAYWDLGSANLQSALEASVASTYSSPLAINIWDAGSSLFSDPNAVSDLSPIADTCSRDGQRLEATGGGSAVAGYSASPQVNEAAIVTGNEGRTVLFGFTPGLFDTDMVDLYENAIVSLQGAQKGPALSCEGFLFPMDQAVTVRRSPYGGNQPAALPFTMRLLDEDGVPVYGQDLSSPPVLEVLFDGGQEMFDGVEERLAAPAVPEELPFIGYGDEGNRFEFVNSYWQFYAATSGFGSLGTYYAAVVSGDESEYVVDPTCMATFTITNPFSFFGW